MRGTVVLVHGSGHGKWLWQRVIPELETCGFSSIAMDLPCDDPTATLLDYRDTVLDACQTTNGDLIVVGHSLAGIVVPLVAEVLIVRRIVLLCAVLPEPGRSQLTTLRTGPPRIDPQAQRMVELGLEHTSEYRGLVDRLLLEPDCGPEEARLIESSRRVQQYGILGEPSPLVAWPSVETTYILATKDHMVAPEWSRWICQQRFAQHPVEIEGGHMIPLTQPRRVAEAITEGL